jgi:hypothetical protein
MDQVVFTKAARGIRLILCVSFQDPQTTWALIFDGPNMAGHLCRRGAWETIGRVEEWTLSVNDQLETQGHADSQGGRQAMTIIL